MGLSMYAYETDRQLDVDVDNTFEESDNIFFTWKNNHNLMSLLNQWYFGRDGKEDLNNSYLPLDAEDLDEIEQVAKNGIASNSSDDEKYDYHQDLEFVKQARERIAAGKSIYFSAWW